MGIRKRKRCCNCKRLFEPDHRNRDRQKYCNKPECRKASKASSQKKWLRKPENKNYFKGPVNNQRVKEWRKRNPGYWKRSSINKEDALQDPINGQVIDINKNTSDFAGIALQDDIARTILLMQQSGQDILFYQPQAEGGEHDIKNPHFTRAGPQGSQKF